MQGISAFFYDIFLRNSFAHDVCRCQPGCVSLDYTLPPSGYRENVSISDSSAHCHTSSMYLLFSMFR